MIETIKLKIQNWKKTPEEITKKYQKETIKKRLEVAKVFDIYYKGKKITQENQQELPISKLIEFYKKDIENWEKII